MLSRARALPLVLTLLALTSPLPARAAPAAEPWSALAHTAFTHQVTPALGGGNSFAQDRSGFLWMGTQTGLIRWDGYRLRRYGADATRADALHDGYVITLLVDRGGVLWIGTSSGGLARYDRAHDNFVTIGSGPGGLAHARVSALADDGAGGVWVGTGAGLEQVGADGTVHPATSGAPRIGPAALPEGGIEKLLRDRAGALWIGTRHGLWRRAAAGAPLQAIALGADRAHEPAINALYQDSAGRVWIGTRATGAYVIDAGATEARPVRESGDDQPLLGERVYSIIETVPGTMWLSTEGGGIIEVDVRHGQTRRIRHQPDAPDSLHDDDVAAMFRERGGQVFVATAQAMSVHDPRPSAFVTLRALSRTGGGKLSVPSILMRPDGRVWMAVDGGAIDIVDPQAGRVATIAARADGGQGGLPKGRVLAMVNGAGGAVYIGTQQGLYRSDDNGAHVRRLSVPGRAADSSVWALAFRAGVLWVGGLDGLWALAPQGSPAVLRHEDTRLGDTRVTAILPAADGAVWIGTRAGLVRLAPDGTVERVAADAKDATRIPPGYVSALLFDHAGRLWVSTFSSGIVLLERTDAAGRRWFHHIGMADGLPDDGVDTMVLDHEGAIWASTDDGLARITPSTLAVRKFGAPDGVQVPTYWTNSGVSGANGELLFGGLSGVTVIHPERVAPRHYNAPLVVTRITLGGRDTPSAPYNAGADAGAAPVTLTPADRERGFALEFAALDYAAPERSRYAYRLAGFDRAWIDVDAALRRVSYNNLPPGDYTLQLRASSYDADAPSELAVPVRVLPAWHQQGWVHALAALALLALAAALMQARTALLRRRQRELEAMVAERTAELRATQSRLETLAYSDPLTGLPNRRMFNDDMRRMAARAARDGEPFTLLLIDLDHFKSVNDALGHDAGDALLVEAAKRLRVAVRATDQVARLGGDEFAVLLAPGCEAATAGAICQRIVDGMTEPVAHGHAHMRVSASVGAAQFAPGQGGVDGLYKAADLALYRAKEAGRGTWRWSSQEGRHAE